ncbi:MAG: acyltransferase [Fusobacterium sp.]|uniref:acyltransferase n=1 Tax=Fusobacterium sp. TaxID=68766 RepID=UPI003992DDC5
MLKQIIKKFLYKEKSSSDNYIEYLRRKGMNIGEDVTIYSPRNTIIDEQYPWLITIGSHVRITEGVIILTHDYSWSVLKRFKMKNSEKGVILGASGRVKIGNNIFIGMNSIILRNVEIGDNVIIGVGSIVTKNCESGWVYAGNPAKKIMRVEEYYSKRKKEQLKEARILALEYKNRYGKIPDKKIFHEYFMLFSNLKDNEKIFCKKAILCGNYDERLKYLTENEPVFKNFEEFINYCFKKENE